MSDPMKDVAEVSAKEGSPDWKFWSREIELALKREERYREKARRVNEIYEADKADDNSFNILYANTETLLPATYNQMPRPMVERRFKDDADPMAKAVSAVVERTLVYLMDSPDAEYERYDDLFRQKTLAAFVPGRGVTWWTYDPEIEGTPAAVEDGKGDGSAGGEAAAVAATEPVSGRVLPEAGEKVVWETVCGEVVAFDKFLCGYARRWKNVPWVAREHAMTRDDAISNFGKDVADTFKYLEDAQEKDDKRKDEGTDDRKNQGLAKTACVYEIWWKSRKQVVFFAPSRKEGLCEEPMADPYKLTGFFPCSEPLQFLKKTTSLVPTPIYYTYEPQAKELNRISRRINKVLEAMKVRGFYDGSLQGLQELLSKDDNTLIPAKNVASLKDGAGANLANSVWFMPLGELMAVVKELYVAREQCKQVIYEITGIADIMRGNTEASETATAQNIKDKWGGLRLQNMQGAVQGSIRDDLRIVAELAGRNFDMETFASMTQLDYATPEQLQQAQAMSKSINDWSAMQPPSTDPSAPPPPPPPEIQQAQQQVQAIQAKPQWEQVLAVLKDNLQRGYKIDIETNSTLANTSSEDQENVTKAMSAIGSMLQQFIPAVQIGVMTMPAVKQMLLMAARRYEFGRQVEAAIEQMPDQLPQPQMTPEMQKAQQDLQKGQEQLQKDQQGVEAGKQEIDAKKNEVTLQIKEAQKELEMTVKAAKQEQEFANQKQLLEIDKKNMAAELAGEKRIGKMQMNQAKHEQKVSMAYATHEQKVDARLSAHEQKVEQAAAKKDKPSK